jgi:TonB family protein
VPSPASRLFTREPWRRDVNPGVKRLPVNTAPRPVVTQYYGRIQTSLRQAFCADRRVRLGGYRVAVGLWIGASGAVARSTLLDTTGDPDLDAALGRAMDETNIGEPPPTGFAQPVVIVVTSDVTRDCQAMHSSAPQLTAKP